MTTKSNETVPSAVQRPKTNLEKTITDSVLARVQELEQVGGIKLPSDYSAANALRSAYLILLETKDKFDKPVLENCTTVSIVNALQNMVVQALNPAKHQCSFIAYGNKLLMQREYQGNIALAKRLGKVKDVRANAIFEGDIFSYEIDTVTLKKKITEHKQTLQSISSNTIKGAYAIVEFENGESQIEIMAMPQIQKSWEMGTMKGNSPAHKSFPDQMAMKTVINRALKTIINSSDDAHLFEDENNEVLDKPKADIKNQIAIEANTIELKMASTEEIPLTPSVEIKTSDPVIVQPAATSTEEKPEKLF